ncbi:MAG: response regulator [Cellvibrionales bacterium]|nr:response regulator [Cellvibrionales bacterium]
MFKGIRAQVIFLSIIPPALIAISIGVYLNVSYNQDLMAFFQSHGESSARQIAQMAKIQLLESHITTVPDQKKTLQRMTNLSLEEKGLRSICLFNHQGEVLAHSGPKLYFKHKIREAVDDKTPTQPLFFRDNEIIAFLQPINFGESTRETHFFNQQTQAPLGWVILEYHTGQFNLQRYHQNFKQNIILFLAFMMSILFGFLFSQRLKDDLTQIKQSIKRFSDDDSVNENMRFSIKEVETIGEDLKKLAKKKKSEFDELRLNVELTSSDLQETIETIEVQNIELSMAQKEAIEASRIKSEFLANTSHEIRTPLNGIIGFTRILSKTPLTSSQMEYLETIQVSSEGLLTIINDILDFSKIEANKLELDNTPFTLRKTLEEVISLLAPQAYDKNLEITLLVYQDVPNQLIGDPTRIKQIFFNLINNAIKFTQAGEITIRVQLESKSQKSCYLKGEVIDSGIGMTENQQKELFQAFYQANSSISREFGGTGLGLTIVKTLIELMQGEIQVKSKKHQGTQVAFTMECQMQETSNIIEGPLLSGQSVALVEPHEPSQIALQQLLEQQGIRVSAFATIESFEENLALFHFDALMVGFSSDTSFETIQSVTLTLSRRLSMPLIILTSLSLEHAQSFQQAGISHCSKPYREHIIQRTLMQVLSPDLVQEQSLSLSLPAFATYELKALAVDDNAANLSLLTIVLEDLGLSVSQAKNGAEAVKVAEAQDVDIIFMDIQMPVMNGIEASKIIRKSHTTPIIALTAHALADEKNKLLMSGIDDYLTKPISEKQIRATINQWCLSDQGIAADVLIPEKITVPDTPSPIDLALSLQVAKNRKAIAIQMFEGLMESLPSSIASINQYHKEGDHKALLDTVHKLHGASCYTGAIKLKNQCEQLESHLKQNPNDLGDFLVDQLNLLTNELLYWAESESFETRLDEFVDVELNYQ